MNARYNALITEIRQPRLAEPIRDLEGPFPGAAAPQGTARGAQSQSRERRERAGTR